MLLFFILIFTISCLISSPTFHFDQLYMYPLKLEIHHTLTDLDQVSTTMSYKAARLILAQVKCYILITSKSLEEQKLTVDHFSVGMHYSFQIGNSKLVVCNILAVPKQNKITTNNTWPAYRVKPSCHQVKIKILLLLLHYVKINIYEKKIFSHIIAKHIFKETDYRYCIVCRYKSKIKNN